MESRLERKYYENVESNISLLKEKDHLNDIFCTQYLSNHLPKNYKVYDHSTMVAMFEKELSIPKSRKDSLLRDIKKNTIQRQIDTVEAAIKKKRKRLDIKKKETQKKKDSKSIIIINKRAYSVGNEELLYKAQTRLHQNYEQIKRILHDHIDYFCYMAEDPEDGKIEERLSTINMLTLKSVRIPTMDQTGRNLGSITYGGKKVIMEDISLDGNRTNDFYDYTIAPLTERQLLDMARNRATWADRRSLTIRTSGASSSGGGYSMGDERRSTHGPKKDSNIPTAYRDSSKDTTILLTQMFDAMGQRMSRASTSFKDAILQGRNKELDHKKDGMFFPGTDEDMKGISILSRKTIQHMNSKNAMKQDDSQVGLKRNVDSYIWYLINPVAKRKYDLFLQKTVTVPRNKSETKISSFKTTKKDT